MPPLRINAYNLVDGFGAVIPHFCTDKVIGYMQLNYRTGVGVGVEMSTYY